jgi:hypothetical protein
MAREAWTDERLDDLNTRVEKGFGRLDADIREVRSEMRAGFHRVDEELRGLRAEMNTRFGAVDARIDSMQRMMIIGFVTIFVSIAGSVIGAALLT